MTIVANAADRLLAAIVPRATAAAWSCTSGCHRKSCGCLPNPQGTHYVWDKCLHNASNQLCKPCTLTVYPC
jgi:hypothetical protein